jgi:predicted ferric reductase
LSDVTAKKLSGIKLAVVWLGIFFVAGIPLGAAMVSPLLAWRDPIYILSGFAGILGLVLLLFQPLMIGGYLPGFSAVSRRTAHRWSGMGLLVLVLVHVIGLWITSPPDVIDALLFASPTAFSLWGVIAMWALFFSAILVVFQRKLAIRRRIWRVIHVCLALLIVTGSVVHAYLIDGTMEQISKIILCILVIAATGRVAFKLWRRAKGRR